jgi:predicted ATPase
VPDAFVRSVVLRCDEVDDFDAYPFAIPAIRALQELELDPHVTFLAGENGCGKSTLVEAIALAAASARKAAAGTWPSRPAPPTPTCTSGCGSSAARARRVPGTSCGRRASTTSRPTWRESSTRRDPTGVSLHEQSHGESFLSLVTRRFGPNGLYLLDEPEAALSLRGSLALMRRMHDLVAEGSQFVVSTHSPILLGYPGARIYVLSEDGIAEAAYEETERYELTRSFLDDRDRFLHYLFADD